MSAALKCDGCGKFASTEHDHEPRLSTRAAPLPVGWLRVFIEDRKSASEGQVGESAEVCSRACGSKWLAGSEVRAA